MWVLNPNYYNNLRVLPDWKYLVYTKTTHLKKTITDVTAWILLWVSSLKHRTLLDNYRRLYSQDHKMKYISPLLLFYRKFGVRSFDIIEFKSLVSETPTTPKIEHPIDSDMSGPGTNTLRIDVKQSYFSLVRLFTLFTDIDDRPLMIFVTGTRRP